MLFLKSKNRDKKDICNTIWCVWGGCLFVFQALGSQINYFLYIWYVMQLRWQHCLCQPLLGEGTPPGRARKVSEFAHKMEEW